MRRLRSASLLPLLGLALVAPGCGGGSTDVPEVPGPPPALTVPHVKNAPDISASATPTPTPTPTAGATATPAGTGTTGTTGGTGTNTGATTTPAPVTQDSPASDQQPAAGSPPQQFEQFCQENAGAC